MRRTGQQLGRIIDFLASSVQGWRWVGLNELVRWQTDHGGVVVEIDSSEPGFQSISRRPGEAIYDVQERFEDALESVRDAAASALKKFRDKILDPESVEIEFGVKLNAEAGAVIAKTSAEGHLIVKLAWSRSESVSG
jgi:Trypsin-co-occurring domain 1